MSPEEKLIELGLELPTPQPPNGTYIPYKLVGNMLYLSGHGPRLPNNIYRVGKIDSLEQVSSAYDDARLAGLNMLATIKMAVGDLGRVEEVVKLLGMINATADFRHHPKVINGCSDLFVSIFGEKGRHPRSAVGVASLPHGMTVEIEGIFQIRS
jgi:enamine deaminase RidA (YjgF/YER057c/UK114 family)